MDGHTRLIDKVATEQDDVLCTLPLVADDHQLADRMWAQLVDLLVESMFLDLRREFLAGDLAREDYVTALTTLADECRNVGLLPLPTRTS